MISLIFLAGGRGQRMGSPIPKQYLLLKGKPIALHSFDLFSNFPEIAEMVVVCEPEYQHFFSSSRSICFALPGPRRQDSVYSGLQKCSQEIVFIHDAVRPFFEMKYIPLLIEAVQVTGAAALGSRVTSTIKQCDADQRIEQTVDRSRLWEMQTPQVAYRKLLLRAYEHVQKHNLEVTDDLGALEEIGHLGKIVPSSPYNIKITTTFDLSFAEFLCATN